MKILFITGINAYGGQEVFLAQLARVLNDHGAEVHLAIPPNHRLMQLSDSLGLTYFTYPFESQIDISTFRGLSTLIKKGGYQIIHTHGTRGGFIGRLAALSCQHSNKLIHHMYVPTNLVAFGDSGRNKALIQFRGSSYQIIERILARCTDRILTVSSHLKNYAISNLKIPESKVSVVFNTGIRSSNIIKHTEAIEINKSLVDQPFRMLYAGKFVHQKGLTYLLKSLSHLRNDRQINNFRLILCGDGILLEKLQQQVRETNLTNYVTFAGWQSDLSRFYRSCDILVMSSLWEGIPLVILDAMSFARAVIATNVGGIPEAVIDEETGFLVNPQDPDALTMVLENSIKDRELIHNLGLNGLDLVKRKFTLESSFKKTIEIYNAVNA